MAKKKSIVGISCPICPGWYGILVLLVGLWFMAADLGYLGTGGLTLWPVVVALVGIKLWLCK